MRRTMATSMIQMSCAPEGQLPTAAFIFSSQPTNFDSAPALLINPSEAANPFPWQPPKSCSPPLEGPFTPVPNSVSLHAELQNDRLHESDDHDYSFLNTIAGNISYSDLLSLNASQLSAGLGMEDWRLAAEEMQLCSQRKLSIYRSNGYGDVGVDDTLLNAASSMTGGVADSRSLILQAANCSDGEKVKLSHLARSVTLPSTSRARAASSGATARSPLLLAGSYNGISDSVFLSNNNTCREISSSVATTTDPSCSAGQPDGQSKAKVVQIKSESLEMTHCQSQQEYALPISTTKGPKQSRKRGSIAGSSITSVKAPRLDTPPDVVHVRARRGQATDSHSLAERVRREKISQRMKVLQEIVPGCHKVLGKAMMLEEIINYVKSLQRQVEFLSMKLAAANHAGIASMIMDKANYTPSNVEIFGDPTTSQLQLMQLEPLIASMLH